MSIVDIVRRKRKSAQETAFDAYAKIMRSANGDRPADVGRLEKLMDELDISADEVASDYAAATEGVHLEASIPSARAQEQADIALTAAADTLKKVRADVEAMLTAAEQDFLAARRERDAIDGAKRRAADRLHELRRNRPRAFGLLPEPARSSQAPRGPLVEVTIAPSPRDTTPAEPQKPNSFAPRAWPLISTSGALAVAGTMPGLTAPLQI